MNRLTTMASLARHIESKRFPVIALTGTWGVGKTRLWEDLARNHAIPHGYVSLFGLTSAQSIKRKLAASISRIDDTMGERGQTAIRKLVTAGLSAADKVLDGKGGLAAAVSAIGDLAGDIYVDKVLEDQVVVLDDFERAHPSLEIETFLGIVDDLRRLRCQVLLILNDKELGTREHLWQRFNEKVVDIQITLQPTQADAIDAVLDTAPPSRRAAIRKAWVETNCGNIRVAQRAIRAVESIFRNRDTKTIDCLIADVVFLAIAEARGFHRDADAEEILRIRTGFGGVNNKDERRIEIESSVPINFSVYRAFQNAVIDYLKSGHVDLPRWDKCIDIVVQDIDSGSASQRLHDWLVGALWDPTVTDDVARMEATQHFTDAWRLDLANAQAFIYALKEIGAPHLVDSFVAAWCAGVESENVLYPLTPYTDPIEPIDQRLLAAMDASDLRINPRPSFSEAVEHEAATRDSRHLDIAAINAATVEDWKQYLLNSSSKKGFDNLYDLHRYGSMMREGRLKMQRALHEICVEQPNTKVSRVIIRSGMLVPAPTSTSDYQTRPQDPSA